MSSQRRSAVGRPEATSHSEIERVAFRLFAERGFEATTLDAIADKVGVGRRTLFRYYSSKNDIPWGQFDATLTGFRAILAASSPELPLWQAVHRGVVAFNAFPADAAPSHRERMQLLLGTPALRAHSMLRYAEWRGVIADFVADREGLAPDDLLPQVVAQTSLALAVTAYERWLADASTPLPSILDESLTALCGYLGSEAIKPLAIRGRCQ